MSEKGRRTTFTILTILFGVGIGGLGLFSLVTGSVGAGGREAHQVHDLGFGALAGILVALPLVLQAINPERKLALMQAIAGGFAAFLLGYQLGGTSLYFNAPILLVALILWWLHPAPKEVTYRPQPFLLALAVLSAIPLAIYAFDQIEIQRACIDGNQHCEEFHYAGMAALSFAIPLVGLVASLRAPGWRIAARLAAAASAVLGLSGILFPDRASSIGTTWGSVAIAGAVLFAAVAELGTDAAVVETAEGRS